MSFIISVESFLSLASEEAGGCCGRGASGRAEDGGRQWTQRPNQTHPTRVSDQECLLVTPNPPITACRNQFKREIIIINNFKKDKKLMIEKKKHFFLTFGLA